MTKKELIDLHAVFIALSNLGKTKFKYTILKNIDKLKTNITILVDLENEIKKSISAFDEARNNLIIKIGNHKEDGSVSIDVSNKEMLEEFNIELKKLIEEHKDELEVYSEKMQEYQAILNEDLEDTFDFMKISIDNLPEDDISTDQLNILVKHNIID